MYLRALYLGESSGRRREGGVDAWARESWKSGGGAWFWAEEREGREVVVIVEVEGEGVGVTTSSRHWGF